MTTSKLILAFISVIKLVVNVVLSSAFGITPLTSIRIDAIIPKGSLGLYSFGKRVPGELLIAPSCILPRRCPI